MSKVDKAIRLRMLMWLGSAAMRRLLLVLMRTV